MRLQPVLGGLAGLVLRRRAVALLVVVALTAALGHQAATRLKIDNSLEEYLATDDPVRTRMERFQAQFGRAEVFLVVAVGDVFSADYLERLRRLEDAIEGLDAPLDEVTSIRTARYVRSAPGLVEVEPLGEVLSEAPTSEELSAFRQRVEARGEPVRHLLDPDGGASAILVRTGVVEEKASHAVYRALLEKVEAAEGDGFALHVAGAPALAAAINARMLTDAYRSLGAAVLLILVLLGLLFRHWLGVVGPLLVVSLSIVWTFGLMALLGYPMTGLHNVLPTFLLTVGLGDSVHLLNAFRRADGETGVERAEAALLATGLPIVLTSLTTAAGLLGFTVTRLGVTIEFGAFAAVGVGLAMLHSLVVLPILLSFVGDGLRGEAERGRAGAWARRVVEWSMRRRVPVLAGTALVAALAGWGASQARVSHNPLRFLPDGHPVRAAFAAADAYLGGTVNVELEIDTGADDGLKDPALLAGWTALEERLRARREVGGLVSWLDIVRETWEALTVGTDAPPLPPTRPAVAQTLLAFEMGNGERLHRMMTPDGRYGRMTARVPWLDAADYRPLAEHVAAVAADAFPAGVEVHPTGGVYTLLTIVDSLISDMLRSFGLAVLLVGLMLVMLLRSPKLGAIAMVPNLLPILITLGVMGAVDIPLDMFNLLLASVAIGIVVDDTVHLFHHVAVARRAGLPIDEAVRQGASAAGGALVITSVVLALGFGAFLTATMTNLVHFGGLLVLTVVAALVAELVVGPALLVTLARR